MKDESADCSSEVAVNGAKSTTLEIPLFLAVMWEMRVSVLEESDQNQVVVDDEVRDEVVADDLGEPAVVRPGGESGDGGEDTNIREDDLAAVSLVEDG